MTTTTSAPHVDADSRRIVSALDRVRAAAAARPDFGRATDTAVAVLGDGVRCTADERSWRIDADLAPALGGERSAPSPGTLMRAALASCLAMGYRLRAAERGIELSAVQVTVEADADVRGMLDPDAEAPPGYTAWRYHVEIDSPAPAAEIEQIIDLGDTLSPMLDALARPQAITRTVSIRGVPDRGTQQ